MQDTDLIKTTPLHAAQAKAGAVFASFDGWYLPRAFGDWSREYAAAREGAAVVDRSNFGRLRITGADALDLLNRLSTNNLIDLGPGEGASTVLTTNKGRIIDLLLVVARLGGELLVVTSPSAAEKVVEWIDLYTFGEDIAVQDVTEETALLSVVGPSAGDLLGPGVRSLGLYGACEIDIEGVLVSGSSDGRFGDHRLRRIGSRLAGGRGVGCPGAHGGSPYGRGCGGDAQSRTGCAPLWPGVGRGVQPTGG